MLTYMGYSQADRQLPYARFYNENIAPVPPHIAQALLSPLLPGTLLSLEEVTQMSNDGYAAAENGYTLEPDGSARVAIHTLMPRVTPPMWDWWFGWHGCRADRYKLWHPIAHRSAQWKDGKDDIAYIGRTSLIEEYIGKSLEKVSIRFVDPSELGLQNSADAVYICARVGYSQFPLDYGWLLHQIRTTNDGAEMRSRFWLAGEQIQLRMPGSVPSYLSKVLPYLRRVQKQQATDLLAHCYEEMNHLAGFLPELYQEFHA